MDMTFLNEYIVLVIVGICLCVGFVIKKSIPFVKNNYIPAIMAILGVLLNVWLNDFTITPSILLGGMFSGLSSTGLHQMFVQIIDVEE